MGDFRQRLAEGVEILGLPVTPAALDRLTLYHRELQKWSQRINLIAKATGTDQIVESHFLDSLTLLPLLQGAGSHLLDIGTGAGFPALVCKAACPELVVTLVEPRLKRVSFLGQVVRTLGLREVTIASCRIEEEEKMPSVGTITHITARAVTELGALMPMVERFAGLRPQLLWMKGPRWREELARAGETVDRSSYRLDRTIEWVLPFSGASRTILLFRVKAPNELNIR